MDVKANDFIRNHGIAEAKRVLHDSRGCAGVKLWGRYEFSTDELNKLVESYELVGNFGGIKRAKRILKKSYTSFNTMVSVVWNDKPFQCTIEKLEKAILDVESCQ